MYNEFNYCIDYFTSFYYIHHLFIICSFDFGVSTITTSLLQNCTYIIISHSRNALS